MNAVSFGFEEKSVRVMDRGGAPWFVAQDVCGCLGIASHRDAISKLEDDERDAVGITDAIGREQSQSIVSESGVYALIFRSRKPEAKRFRKWVTQEVLPTLRRTGAYLMGANDQADEAEDPLPLDAPDDIERMRVKLGLVREARYVYGRKTARGLWEQLGLPEVDKDRPLALTFCADEICPLVRGWLHERCDLVADAREESGVLYDDYRDWCEERDEIPLAIRKFGEHLHKLGFTKIKSNRVHRIGIRMKD